MRNLDCYGQLSGGQPPPPEERIGWSETAFFRSGLSFAPLAEQGPLDVADAVSASWQSTIDLVTGSVDLFAEGSFTTADVIGDPLHGLHVPVLSSCGWSRAEVPEYSGPYELAIGSQIPDARLFESVRRGRPPAVLRQALRGHRHLGRGLWPMSTDGHRRAGLLRHHGPDAPGRRG